MKYDFPIVLVVAFIRVRDKIKRLVSTLLSLYLCWAWGIVAGSVLFLGPVIIRTRRRGEIRLGKGVVFVADSRLNAVGLNCPTMLETMNGGRIEVGDYSGFSAVAISSHTSVRVGSRVKVGANVKIFDHDFHAIDAQIRSSVLDRNNVRTLPIEIGDDCFIGAGSVILKGSRLGPRTIVAAGSVVFGLSTPSDSLVRGNPAVVVSRKRI